MGYFTNNSMKEHILVETTVIMSNNTEYKSAKDKKIRVTLFMNYE
jgi:hypothetical protein